MSGLALQSNNYLLVVDYKLQYEKAIKLHIIDV